MAQKFTPFDSRSFSSGSQMESALFFAKQGVPVLPLYAPAKNGCHCNKGATCSSAGKHPMTKHGFKDATVNPAQIRSWWQTVPNANIGFVTGKESGLIVLDVDPRHGGDDSLAQLQEEFGDLPKTLKVRTGGDGWHYYFLHPGTHIPNKTNMRAGLDVRGDGGYIVAPPSLHVSQKHYQWDGETVEVSPLPSWLLELIVKKEVATIAKQHAFLGEGSRNNSLLSIAGFLTSKGLQVDQLGSALQIFNETLCHPPLGAQEVAQIVSSIARYQEATWEEPQPLPEEIKAQELDASFLPKPLKAWCEDISERMQVPLEFVAGPALVMFASLIGRKMVVCPKQKDKWEVVPKLWGLLISPPGSLKSPTLNAVLKPLNELSIKARAEFTQAQQKLKEQEVVARTEIEALKDSLKKAVRDGKPDQIAQKKTLLEATVRDFEEKNKLTEKRYVANDPTTEKLLTIIADNPQGILLFRDELSGWLESMQKSGREGDREFFLESWNGDTPFTMDRIGRGTVSVEGLCLSVLGGLQPSKFESYVASVVRGGKSDDGLLQRFQILLYPERRKTWYKVDREPNEQAFKTIQKIVEVIDAIPHPKRTENGIERLKIRYDDEAQQIADEWAENLEYRLINEKMSPIFEGHLSKFRSLMPSLALIFCTLEQAGKSAGKLPESIDSCSVELAIEWCFFLETHAKRAYGEVLEPGKTAARHLLAKIQKKAVRDFDRPRDLYRKRWKGLGTAEDFEAAISTLAEYGWLRVEALSSDGRNTEVIRLHPSLRAG